MDEKFLALLVIIALICIGSICAGFFYKSFFLMQSSLAFSKHRPFAEEKIKHFIDRSCYKEYTKKIQEDQHSVINLTGPKDCGKSLYLKWLASTHPYALYYDVNGASENENAMENIAKILSKRQFHVLSYICPLMRMYGKNDMDMFNSALTGNYFKENFGHKPIIIFDNADDLNKTHDIFNFAKKAMISNHYKVILCGRNVNDFSGELNEYKVISLPKILCFSAFESDQYHRALRPADSDKIIQNTRLFIQGNFVQYNRFFNYASEYPEIISEKNFKKIIKKLIYRERFDFDNAYVNFDLILEGTTECLKTGSKDILNAIQIIYWLIKEGSPLTEKDVREFLSPEVLKFDFFNFFKADCGTPYIDFKTNLHKMYACREMGLLRFKGYNERSFEEFSNILMKRYNFKFKKLEN